MLFCSQINNYSDFMSRFGYKTGIDGRCLVNANGVKQRKNNIAFLYWKEKCISLRRFHGCSLSDAYEMAPKLSTNKDVFAAMLAELCHTHISDACPVVSFGNFEILFSGFCIDGDVNSIQYLDKKTGHRYKIKIGKYVNKYLDWLMARSTRTIEWLNNPTLRIFFIEELTELWKNKRLKDLTLKVVVDKDFQAIYSRARRPKDSVNFQSCMDDDRNWNYYLNNKDIYDAVSLQDDEGLIYARAILVTCQDSDNNTHKYLERIYCNKRMYKDLLFEKAKNMGIFDLFKGLEASCHDNEEIYSVKDKCRIPYTLHINVHLKDGDYLSYQDTFKWYYKDEKKAYNRQIRTGAYGLATTSEHISL